MFVAGDRGWESTHTVLLGRRRGQAVGRPLELLDTACRCVLHLSLRDGFGFGGAMDCLDARWSI